MNDNQIQKKANVPTLRFPEFSGEWERKTLGEDCEINMCKRIFASQTSDTGDVPFYKIGTIGGKADAFISQALFEEYRDRYNFPQKGDVLISCAGTVGKTVVYDGQPAYFQDSNIVWVSNPKQLYINSFLRYILSRVDWRKLNTTTIIRIYNDNLRELAVNFPSVKEQEKIVGLLSLIDELIAIQSKIIEDLKKLKTAICNEVFSHGRDKCVKLCDTGAYFNTMSLSKEDLSTTGNACILYGELFTTYDRVIDSVKSHTQIAKSSATLSEPNDLLFPASTTVDALSLISPAAIRREGVILGGDMFGIRLTERYDNRYMSNLLFSCYRKKLAAYAQGSTIIHLHYNDIRHIRINVHDIMTQQKIADALDAVDKKTLIEQSILDTLKSQKTILLKGLFI